MAEAAGPLSGKSPPSLVGIAFRALLFAVSLGASGICLLLASTATLVVVERDGVRGLPALAVLGVMLLLCVSSLRFAFRGRYAWWALCLIAIPPLWGVGHGIAVVQNLWYLHASLSADAAFAVTAVDAAGRPVPDAVVYVRTFYVPKTAPEKEFIETMKATKPDRRATTSADGAARFQAPGIGSEYTSIFAIPYGRKMPSSARVIVEKEGLGSAELWTGISLEQVNELKITVPGAR